MAEEAPRPRRAVPPPTAAARRRRLPVLPLLLGAVIAATAVGLRARRSQPAQVQARAAAPAAGLRACRPYAEFAAALKSGSESDEELVRDAACLCSLAGGFMVQNVGPGLQPLIPVPSCPAGSVARPFEPDAKAWLGQWIDEPGHDACACYLGIHSKQMYAQRLVELPAR